MRSETANRILKETPPETKKRVLETVERMMLKPQNQWQLALWYLINWESFNLKDLINDSMFYKFQSRLSEIEKDHGAITDKQRKNFTNRFGQVSTYVQYTCIDRKRAREIFNLYN